MEIIMHPFTMKLIKKYAVADTLDPNPSKMVSVSGADAQMMTVRTRMAHNDL
jgi:hypothetical protein